MLTRAEVQLLEGKIMCKKTASLRKGPDTAKMMDLDRTQLMLHLSFSMACFAALAFSGDRRSKNDHHYNEV